MSGTCRAAPRRDMLPRLVYSLYLSSATIIVETGYSRHNTATRYMPSEKLKNKTKLVLTQFESVWCAVDALIVTAVPVVIGLTGFPIIS